SFKTKPEIALEQIGEAIAAGGPPRAAGGGGGARGNPEVCAAAPGPRAPLAAGPTRTKVGGGAAPPGGRGGRVKGERCRASWRGELGKRISVRSLALRLPNILGARSLGVREPTRG